MLLQNPWTRPNPWTRQKQTKLWTVRSTCRHLVKYSNSNRPASIQDKSPSFNLVFTWNSLEERVSRHVFYALVTNTSWLALHKRPFLWRKCTTKWDRVLLSAGGPSLLLQKTEAWLSHPPRLYWITRCFCRVFVHVNTVKLWKKVAGGVSVWELGNKVPAHSLLALAVLF